MLKKEWQAIFKHKFFIIVIIALSLVPAIYNYIFLGSMWDPYGNLKNLPVAVVNLDKPSELDGKTLKLGDEVISEMKKSQDLDYHFVSESSAKEGIKKGDYYMVITFPKNFSENAASLMTKTPKAVQLDYQTSRGHNYISSKMSDSAVTQLKAKVSENITKEYTEAIFDQVSGMKPDMKDAADGSKKLADGTASLLTGSSALSEHLQVLATSSLTFSDGAASLKVGVDKYIDGVNQAAKGGAQLADGSKQFSAGANDLAAGTQTLADKSKALSAGISQLTQGATQTAQLASGTQQLADGINQLTNGVQSQASLTDLQNLQNGLTALDTALKNSSATPAAQDLALQMENLAQAAQQTTDPATQVAIMTALSAMQKDLAAQTQSLVAAEPAVAGAQSAVAGLIQVSSSLPQLQVGANQVNAGMNQLNTSLSQGGQQLSSGFEQFAAGVNQVNDGAHQLADKSKDLQTGSMQLLTGLSALQANSSTLSQGTGQLADGAKQMASGSGQLADGSQSLTNGLNALNSGAEPLSQGLTQANQTLSATNSDKKNADKIASPLTTKHTDNDNVPVNGEGMTPYMIAVALFIGALATNVVVGHSFSGEKWKSGREFMLAKIGTNGLIALLQAFIVYGAVVALGLHANYSWRMLFSVILISLAFMAINTFFLTWLGKVGEFVMIVFLVLQLATSAGTYPLQLAPHIFQVISPWLPMTYALRMLRETIGLTGQIGIYVLFFGVIILVFTGLLSFFKKISRFA